MPMPWQDIAAKKTGGYTITVQRRGYPRRLTRVRIYHDDEQIAEYRHPSTMDLLRIATAEIGRSSVFENHNRETLSETVKQALFDAQDHDDGD